MKPTALRSDGTTTCCNESAYLNSDEDQEYCFGCHQPVQIRVVKQDRELIMVAGMQPCAPIRVRYKPKRSKPSTARTKRTTARRGRGKGTKR